MSAATLALLQQARRTIRELQSVVVGLSGGVDSSLLAKLCVDTLGADRCVAAIANSPSLPGGELEAAVDVAQDIGIPWEIIDTDEVSDVQYAANPMNRCYFCRDELFTQLAALAERTGMQSIAYGEIADDLGDHRPGRAAAVQHGVRAPLREVGLRKDDVRELARHFDLAVWDKPAMACLASRIPYGDPVTVEKLQQVDQAERALTELGLRRCRVRHHNAIARIEVDRSDLAAAVDQAEQIVAAVRAAGFQYVALDLDGYRSGSLNVPGRQPLPLA